MIIWAGFSVKHSRGSSAWVWRSIQRRIQDFEIGGAWSEKVKSGKLFTF
jgi:hypothetical protein